MHHPTDRLARSGNSIHAETRRIVEAVSYLSQCRHDRRYFAVLIGERPATLANALGQFTETLTATTRLARTPAPTDSGHAFLESTLSQFGFDPFDASADDLQRLLGVVLRQADIHTGGSVLLVEDAPAFGPRVWETIRELVLEAEASGSALLVVLTGNQALHRVLDSSGMDKVAHMTRVRFDIDAVPSVPRDGADDSDASSGHEAALLISCEQQPMGRVRLDRDRVLIGRAEQSDIQLQSRFVSRQHALLIRNPDGDWLIDLKSTNGTIVNSTLIDRQRLQPGDVVSIGNFRLRYETTMAAASARLPSMQEPDDLSETVVMRSLKGLHAPQPTGRSRPSESPGTSSAA